MYGVAEWRLVALPIMQSFAGCTSSRTRKITTQYFVTNEYLRSP
jgi:hypothetical protein